MDIEIFAVPDKTNQTMLILKQNGDLTNKKALKID